MPLQDIEGNPLIVQDYLARRLIVEDHLGRVIVPSPTIVVPPTTPLGSVPFEYFHNRNDSLAIEFVANNVEFIANMFNYNNLDEDDIFFFSPDTMFQDSFLGIQLGILRFPNAGGRFRIDETANGTDQYRTHLIDTTPFWWYMINIDTGKWITWKALTFTTVNVSSAIYNEGTVSGFIDAVRGNISLTQFFTTIKTGVGTDPAWGGDRCVLAISASADYVPY